MNEADEVNRPGCYENLAYHLAESRLFLNRLGMKRLHDEVRSIQEQVQREWQREKERTDE